MDLRALLAGATVYRLCRRLLGREASRRAYARAHFRLEPGQSVLDLGCGPGDLLSVLPPVHYLGIDVNPHYIARARRRWGARGTFECRAITDALPVEAGRYDLVIAQGVLHHLDDADARRLCRVARRALRPGGRLVTCDGCRVPGQAWAARLLLALDRGRHVRDQAGYEALARSAFDHVESQLRHDLVRLPYTQLVMECTA